jgi:hypothetical protein
MYAANQHQPKRLWYLAKTWFPVCDVKGGLDRPKGVSWHGSRYTNVSFRHVSIRVHEGTFFGKGVRGGARPGMREGAEGRVESGWARWMTMTVVGCGSARSRIFWGAMARQEN